MSEPNPDQQPEIFYPSSKDGKLFSKIGKVLLQLSKKDKGFRNLIRNHYLNLRKDERLKEIRGRLFEIFSPYFALAKAIDESYGREFLFQHVLRFAKKYIDAIKEEHWSTDRSSMVIYFVWTYVKPLSEDSYFAEERYFWAFNMRNHVRGKLTELFGKPDPLTVNELTKILAKHGILLGGKVKRVNEAEDLAEKNISAWHYHIDVEGLRTQAEGSLKNYYEDEDTDDPADRGDL